MRFSLKWILAGTIYAALAAAALSQGTWVYADLLWAASLVGFGCAMLMACFLRGASQVAGAGFVVFAACYLVCLVFSPDSIPTRRLAASASQMVVGPSVAAVQNPSASASSDPFADGVNDTFGSQASDPFAAPADDPFGPPGLAAPQGAPSSAARRAASVDLTQVIRAGNAIGMMVFGVLGLVCGSVISRASKRTGPIGPPAPPITAHPIRRRV